MANMRGLRPSVSVVFTPYLEWGSGNRGGGGAGEERVGENRSFDAGMCVCVCARVSVHVCVCLPLPSHHDEFSEDTTLLWGTRRCLHVQWCGVADTPGEERKRGEGEEKEVAQGRQKQS